MNDSTCNIRNKSRGFFHKDADTDTEDKAKTISHLDE